MVEDPPAHATISAIIDAMRRAINRVVDQIIAAATTTETIIEGTLAIGRRQYVTFGATMGTVVMPTTVNTVIACPKIVRSAIRKKMTEDGIAEVPLGQKG